MSRYLKNNKGYTLFLTLVIIVFLSIFLMMFNGMILNHNKLVEHSDKIYEATSVAEMGIEHYRARILNKTYDYAVNAANHLNELQQQKLQKEEVLSETEIISIKNYYISSLKNDLRNFLNKEKTKKTNLIDYSIKTYNVNNRLITVIVQGTEGTREKEISMTIQLPENLVLENGISEINHNNIVNPNTYPINNCSFKNLSNLSKQALSKNENYCVELNGYDSFPQIAGNNNKLNARVYIKGEGTANFGHIKGKGLTLLTTTGLKINQHFNLENSIIKTNKDLSIEFTNSGNDNKHKTFVNSLIVANYFELNSQGRNRSLQFVNSNMCVLNTPSSSTLNSIDFDNKSYIYVLNNDNYLHHPNIKYVDAKEFNNKCGTSVSNNLTTVLEFNPIIPSESEMTVNIKYH